MKISDFLRGFNLDIEQSIMISHLDDIYNIEKIEKYYLDRNGLNYTQDVGLFDPKIIYVAFTIIFDNTQHSQNLPFSLDFLNDKGNRKVKFGINSSYFNSSVNNPKFSAEPMIINNIYFNSLLSSTLFAENLMQISFRGLKLTLK